MKEFFAENGIWIIGAICVIVFVIRVVLTLKKAKKIDREGIETDAVVSKIVETYDPENHSSSYTTYVKYMDRDGNTLESPMTLTNCPEHSEGDEVRIKYIPGDKKLGREVKQ